MTDILKSHHFSFSYGGKPFEQILSQAAIKKERVTDRNEDAESYDIIYLIEGQLQITEHLDIYRDYSGVRWYLEWENLSDTYSGILSDIYDCDICAPFYQGYRASESGHCPIPDHCPQIYRTQGSNWKRDEYASYSEYLLPEQTLHYACAGGRSCQGLMPYFDICQDGRGLLCAIGWTGQWHAEFSSGKDFVRLRTGIENTRFYLKPHEKLRTSSVVLTAYTGGRVKGHNLFRRLYKKHFSPIGQPGNPQEGPLSFMTWGALSSDKMIERVSKLKEHGLVADYYWLDAGWYGHSDGPCANEHVGDWGNHTGSWNVNPYYHPDGLQKVAQEVKKAGSKLLLWIEPERVMTGTDSIELHPDWYLKWSDDTMNRLLNLGNEEALQGTFAMISGLIEQLGVGCYRQDFNIDPLPYWERYDEPDRQGIMEIRHITGLYRLYDMLLERFPGLLIDNCASGGRRNDIEMLSRSIPLWRSDYQCWWDAEPEVAQIHSTGAAWWLPYTGTGLGRYWRGKYAMRSCYSAAMACAYWMYDDDDVEESVLDDIQQMFEEYRRVRKYFSCDYYPLTADNSLCDTAWCAWQYHCPEGEDGIVLAFRRPKSPMYAAKFQLGGLAPGKVYRFEDADTKQTFELTCEELRNNGLELVIENTSESRLLYYTCL